MQPKFMSGSKTCIIGSKVLQKIGVGVRTVMFLDGEMVTLKILVSFVSGQPKA